MSKKKLLALAISDIHLHNWKAYNENMQRTKSILRFLQELSNKAADHKIPILFPGDLFHGAVGPDLLEIVVDEWPAYFSLYLHGISGNHDQERKSYPEAPASSMVTYYGKSRRLNCLDFDSTYICQYVKVWGIPYLTYNKGFVKEIENIKDSLNPLDKNILMIHTDLHGAIETDGREVDTVEGIPKNLAEFFAPFDLVLCGHIHKPQEIVPGKIIIVGAPNQQRKSDANGEFGYWEIYDDLSYKFKPVNHLPKFKFYEEGEAPGDDFNYWIMNRKDGVDVLDEDELEFSARASSTHLAKAFLKATGEKRISHKKALINVLKEVDNDTI